MKIYKYWAQDTRIINGTKVFSKAGSNVSDEDAQNLLNEKFKIVSQFYDGIRIPKAERNQQRLMLSGGKTGNDYEAPICEEIIEELDPHNIITRNRYGALVLNSDDHCFIDVDIQAAKRSIFNIFKTRETFETRVEKTLDFIEQYHTKITKSENLSFRIYRTCAGFRIAVSGNDELMKPTSPIMKKLFSDLKADTLYAALCKKQNCYRARLTPKPYRINVPTNFKSNFKFPYDNPEGVIRWADEYNKRSEQYAVCRLMLELGNPFTSPIIKYHDNICKSGKSRILA